jgi:homoserine dehydrogenase
MESKLVIGLFGFGTVGEGIYHILQQTPSLQARIKKICIKNAAKPRSIDAPIFTPDHEALLDDAEINLIVELIDDAAEALKIVTTALQRGKAVVSANKKMIAENLPFLLALQQQQQVPFLYEASVCGSIPIIRNLEEYYDNDFLKSICGIVNGSTNFILTRMEEGKLDYGSALRLAQQAGFAESNPALDVQGIDAVNKLAILLLHAYGIVAHPQQLLHLGINHIHPYDAQRAAEKGWKLKLTAQALKLASGHVAAFVLPQYVTPESQLYGVRNEFNAVVLQTTFADKQFLYGKGAGRYPTASAVLSDVSALRYQYRYEYRKWHSQAGISLTDDFYLRVYVSFEVWHDVELKDFEWVEEFFSDDSRQYLIGVIAFKKLKAALWLQKPSVSLVLCPDAVVEDISARQIRKKSLELAGSHFVEKTNKTIHNLPQELLQI